MWNHKQKGWLNSHTKKTPTKQKKPKTKQKTNLLFIQLIHDFSIPCLPSNKINTLAKCIYCTNNNFIYKMNIPLLLLSDLPSANCPMEKWLCCSYSESVTRKLHQNIWYILTQNIHCLNSHISESFTRKSYTLFF